MKYVKRFFIGLIILLILAGGTVFVLITFYKKELAGLLTDTLKTNYGLTLKVEDIRVSFFSNWPHASVQLKNVFIANEATGNTEPILRAGSLALSFNLEKMLHKQFVVKYISVSDGEVDLIRNADGSRNFEFKKQAKDSTAKSEGISFEVNKIAVNNIRFRFLNKQREQNISIHFMGVNIRMKQYQEGIEASVKGKTLVNGLLFNVKNGEFLKNTRTILDVDLNYLYETRSICIYAPSHAEIEGHNYNVTSLITLGENRRLALEIESKKIKFERVSALLTPKIHKVLSNFEVKRPIDAKILLVVNLGEKEDPVIIGEVKGQNCDLTIGNSKIPYSELNFRGRIRSLDTSGKRGNMEEATLVFEPVKGKVYDFPFTASVRVKNLVQPVISIDAGLLIEAKKIPFSVSKDFVLKGSAIAKVKYSGPTKKINKLEFLKSPMKLAASVTFRDLSYKEMDRPYVYTVNGKAMLDNSDLQFESLHVKTDIAEANVKGKAEGFVPYIFGFSKGFKANIAARTENLDLNPVFIKNKENTKESTSTETKVPNKKIAQSQFEFTVNLFAKRLVFRKVEATNASVDLFYRENSLHIRSASVNTCDGRIVAKAMIRDFNRVDADISVTDVNVKKLFEQFENFGQEAIVSENLRGNIFIDAKFKTDLDQAMNLKPETMAGEVKLKLINGHLINYEPVQNLSNFLFRNRDFNDVSFTELNETFKLKGYEMEIQELEIGSNILNLFVVDGLYNFRGNSNVNILIPWSNLKKRGKNYIPKNSGESAENTKGVKLNFNGPSKKMKLSLGHKPQEKHL